MSPALLEKEKELTRNRDMVNTERRRLPMVRVDKTDVFDGLGGQVTLGEQFGDRMQLIVQHIMFARTGKRRARHARTS